MTIKVNELGVPLSPNTPRAGDWVTVEEYQDETLVIRDIKLFFSQILQLL